MKEQITEMVEAFWAKRRPALMQFVAQRTSQIENLLVLEDFYRTGRKDEALQKAMGGFGMNVLDLTALSSVLERGGGSRTMQKERYHRIQTMFQEMEKLGEGFAKSPPACCFLDLKEGPDAVVDAFDHHIEPLAKAFRTLRIAEIEARANYDPALHDTFFENFNWRPLGSTSASTRPTCFGG